MRPKRALVSLLLVCSCFLSLPASNAVAQGLFGAISGTVLDASGGVVPGATVRVINLGTNVSTVLKTNNAGAYSANSLNPGAYRVEAQAPGFKTAVTENVALDVNVNREVNLTLQVGESSQSITIADTAPLLQTQQSSLGSTVTTRQLEQLPVQSASGRSVFNLVPLAAGVTQQVGEGGFDLDNARINGGRPRMDDYLLDGTSIEQPTFGGPTVTPSVDSVQELRVETNNFSAEYGKVSGGVISVTTKGGTNQFHGSVYEFLRNNVLDGRDFFASSNLPLRYNEFGATFGGRIIRDKLFFFTDYQGVRSSTTSPLTDLLVPSADFRNGNLSALSAPFVNPQTGAVFAGNQIPVSPIAAKLLALYPLPNGGPSGQPGISFWSGAARYTSTVNRLNPRIDWNPGSKDHIFGIYHYQRERYDTNSGLSAPLAGNSYNENPADTVTAGWTHTFSSTVLNDARFGWDNRSPLRTTNGYGVVGPADFGISGFPACNLQESNGKCGAPTIGIFGYTGVGGGGNLLIEPASETQFTDILTKVWGLHTLRIGGEIRRAAIDNIQPNSVTGSFAFNGNGTGNPFADFLLGYLAKSSVQVQSRYLQVRTWADALFVQDDWKILPKLTLNLGLRWQYDPSWHELNHQLASFNPYTLQWIQNGVNGAPEGSINTHWKEFGPRVGFAWSPVSRLVVRGGFGITYPGVLGHGRGGDGNASPNILAATQINPGTYISSLPPINLPNPSAPLTLGQAEYFFYTPYRQAPTYFEQWNFTVERQLATDTLLQVAYTGSHGVHLPVNYGYNVCQQSPQNVALYGSAAGSLDSPYCAPGNSAALGGFYGDYIFPGWWGLSSSIYHALQTKVEKRFSRGFSVLSTFTWSKLIDDSSSDWSGFGSLDVYGQNFYDRRAERSVSAGDVPLRWVLSPIVELPFGPGKKWLNHGVAAAVLGGWRTSAIYTLSSGGPIGINDGGYRFCDASRKIAVRPSFIGNPLPGGFQQSIGSWFNTSAFDWSGTCVYTKNLVQSFGSANPAFAFGDAPRYLSNVRAPGVNNLDFSLQKDFKLPLGEQGRLRLQADGFNVLNHAQFAPPDSTADANFGRITATRTGGRILQLGVHLFF